ncbi:MAG: zf-HC2 domain-containing protein [Oscillospiraceae bacterium]|nr:zf-HC2 domain-containing protein [Oscillospiraceae bacterium]
MKDCELIRDLMPLYADDQTSDVSRQYIEEHTARCPACKKLLQEMCTPMEPEPEDRTEQILEMLRRKQRRKTLLTLASVVLAVIIAVWGFLEIRYSGELIYTASTNEEKILKEMPGLAPTDAEKELAKTILEVPMVRDALREDVSDFTIFKTDDAVGYFASILPEDAKIVEIAVMGHSVYFSYTIGNVYTIIAYNDADMTGHVDTISKTVAVSPLDEIGDDGVLGDVDAVYELTHDVATDISRYQKIKSRHMWFSFLDWF